MNNYYSDRLNSYNLKRCYEIASERIKQFLEAEIKYSLSKINSQDRVLDLGCGYGRIAGRIAGNAKEVVGIDISKDNIDLAKRLFKSEGLYFFEMDAQELKFENNYFDVTLCLQNGISAFKIEPARLIKEALRVTRQGGLVLVSTYSEKIWKERLNWFEKQAEEGLLGEIDYNLTRDGKIVCKDDFTAITFSKEEFLELASKFAVGVQINEIDNSSLFCELLKL
jgi:2-polyprenyl-6-hydroxyphenyl methylase/3-demethylubiquinone-9 3-methyltransferase